MAFKTINFDLFKLKLPADSPVKFKDLFESLSVNYIPMSKDSKTILRTIDFIDKGDWILGAIDNIQMTDLPNQTDVKTQETNPLNIPDTSGLSFPTCFLYDKELDMVAFESGKNKLTFNNFCAYFEYIHNIKEIQTEIVLDPVDYAKLANINYISKFSVKIVKLQTGTVFHSKKKAVSNIIKAADDTDNSVLDLTLSSGLSRKSLKVSTIKNYITSLLSFKDSEEVTKIEINGREENEEHGTVLNFIENKVRFAIDVERKRNESENSIFEKLALLQTAYLKRRHDLLKSYKEK